MRLFFWFLCSVVCMPFYPPASAFVTVRKTCQALFRTSWERSMSAVPTDHVLDETTVTKKTLRVLAFHGSEGTGLEFSVRLYPLREALLKANVDMQITAISAPFKKGHGYAWWTMAQGERSFNAEEYIGFEESASIVLKAFSGTPPDLVLGHSQGAILIAALLAQNRIPNHPTKGHILNGVAWPNPYGQQLLDLKLSDDDAKVDDDDSTFQRPRLLFLIAEEDPINPVESAKQVRDCLKRSGFHASTHTHGGGHSLPDDEESIRIMAEWILQGY